MNKKILVVDDEADVRTFLRAVLKKNGYEVITASNGAEAFERVREHNPALVVLDMMMPRQTGTDFFRNLAKDEALSNTPIIIVSGLSGHDLALKEPVAVFDKPIDPDEFIAAVEKGLQKQP